MILDNAVSDQHLVEVERVATATDDLRGLIAEHQSEVVFSLCTSAALNLKMQRR